MGTYSIFSGTTDATVGTFTGGPFCLGTEIGITATPCWATTLWFYRNDTTITGAILGRLYSVVTSTTGTAVTGTDVTFVVGASGLGPTGWIGANMASPVSLATGHYRVTILWPGSYSATNNYWDAGLPGSADIVHGPLTAYTKVNATGAIQGSFTSSATMAYPAGLGSDSNYWCDITVTNTPNGRSKVLTGAAVTRAATI